MQDVEAHDIDPMPLKKVRSINRDRIVQPPAQAGYRAGVGKSYAIVQSKLIGQGFEPYPFWPVPKNLEANPAIAIE